MTKRVNLVALVVGCVVVLTLAQTGLALPSYGANCQSCHSSALGTMTITDNDMTANPAEGCGTPDLGILPVFTVAQGATKTLSGLVSGIPSGARYAAVMKQFEKTGVVSCSSLTYTPDATWLQRTAPAPTYFTLPLTGTFFTAPGGATSFPFNITVGAATPPDYYDLVLAVAGLSGNTFYTESHFYVQVTAAAPTNPTISLDKMVLTPVAAQGASPPNDAFTVSNTGARTLNYTITADVAWLTVLPTSGFTTAAANPISVQYNSASLAAGTYPATITVSDPAATNNPQTIGVTLTINAPGTPPAISLSQALLTPTATQGANPAADAFTVANTDGGTLNYDISASANWLLVSPTGGSTTATANPITVQYNTASLAAGTYPATITVSDPAATNSPQIIGVTLTINAPSALPVISLSQALLTPTATQGANPAADAFTITNTGGGTLNYIVNGDASWLVVSPTSGASTGEADTIAVQYNTTALAAGTYAATITVSDFAATNSPQIIAVTLTLNAPARRPTIMLDQTSLTPAATLGSNPPDDSFTIRNSGGGALNYTVRADAAWLLVSPLSGSVADTAADTITVPYLTPSLSVGTYSAKITVSGADATNSPQEIDVTLTITDEAPAGAPLGICGLGFPLAGTTMLFALLVMKAGLARRLGRRRFR